MNKRYLEAVEADKGITIGKHYEIMDEDDKNYSIDNDFGEYYYIPKWQVGTQYCGFIHV